MMVKIGCPLVLMFIPRMDGTPIYIVQVIKEVNHYGTCTEKTAKR